MELRARDTVIIGIELELAIENGYIGKESEAWVPWLMRQRKILAVSPQVWLETVMAVERWED